MSDELRKFIGTNKPLCNSLQYLAKRRSTRLTDKLVCEEAANRIEELEAKLAKVVEAADAMAVAIEGQIDIYDASEDEVVALHNYCTTITELKVQDDGN